MMSDIVRKYLQLNERIAATAQRFGRNPNDVTLLAVTKLAQAEQIRAIYDAGHRDFGENHFQRILPKMDTSPKDIRWHFIGAVQTNKINKMLNRFHLVHGIDSSHIADALEVRCARETLGQRVLIEVRTSDEATKHGIEPTHVGELAHHIAANCPHLSLDGLMTIAPYTNDRHTIARCFETVRNIRDDLQKDGIALPHLSMGMTDDWEIALEYGATILRIGTAIFG